MDTGVVRKALEGLPGYMELLQKALKECDAHNVRFGFYDLSLKQALDLYLQFKSDPAIYEKFKAEDFMPAGHPDTEFILLDTRAKIEVLCAELKFDSVFEYDRSFPSCEVLLKDETAGRVQNIIKIAQALLPEERS